MNFRHETDKNKIQEALEFVIMIPEGKSQSSLASLYFFLYGFKIGEWAQEAKLALSLTCYRL